MKNFNEIDLPTRLIESLEFLRFTTPTPIQAQAIPVALEGKDILGSAQTGTGKTAAFAIPVITRLLNDECHSALILTPTRELASQVLKAFHQLLGRKSPINSALLIGGESINKQSDDLRKRPRIIVGTPGRVNDHIKRNTLKLQHTDLLVLDEMDRMLDMGFSIQIDTIVPKLNKQRQTLMFSATLPKNILKLAEKYLIEPQRIAIGSETAISKKIKQEVIHLNEAEKYDELTRQIEQREGSIIVFVNTKRNADKLAFKLNKIKLKAEAIHGDLRQAKRSRIIKTFRNKKYRIMVATDIAARGLDIPHIEHVINYDLPQCPEDYIHRIGRTARAGADGSALCFLSPHDKGKWFAIQRLINPNSKTKSSPNSKTKPRSNKKANTRFSNSKKPKPKLNFQKPRKPGFSKRQRQSAV